MKLIYEGKAKKIFEDGVTDTVIMEFKDSLTAFNAQKKGSFDGKGALNLKFTQKIFDYLAQKGVSHHIVEVLDGKSIRVKKLKMLPVEVVVRNKAAGSFSKRLGIEEGRPLKKTLIEYYLKDDALGDPLLTEAQLDVLDLMTKDQVQKAEEITHKINSALKELFAGVGVDLIDFKIELGIDSKGQMTLADEITPDSCRLWDQKTQEKLDKDVFRRDLGDVSAAYKKIAQNLGVEI